MNTKQFTGFTEDRESGTRRCNPEAWKVYWDGLSENEKDSLRNKAKWEHMTLMAVAIEWGASNAA